MPIEFNFPAVSLITFVITVGIMGMVLICLALYLSIMVWVFGKPLRKYFLAKLTPGSGIIQEYSHESLEIHMAREQNGEFIDLERKGYFSEEKAPKKWYHFKKQKTIFKPIKPLLGKSIVAINGVKTLLVWNINPKLPDMYVSILNALIENTQTTVQDINNDLNDKLITISDIIPGTQTTYSEFFKMHELMEKKYNVFVSADDIYNFNAKYTDEHPTDSVIEKEVVVESKRRSDNKYQKWAFIIIGIMVVGGIIIKLYQIYSK